MAGKFFFFFFRLVSVHLFVQYISVSEKRLSCRGTVKSAYFLFCSIPVFLPFLNSGLMWWYLIFLSGLTLFFESMAESWQERDKDKAPAFVLLEIFFVLSFIWVSFWAASFIKSTWFQVRKGPAYLFFGNNFIFAGVFGLLFWPAFSKIKKQLKQIGPS